jgi:hypothetical protein
MDGFWDAIDAQLKRLKTARTSAEVIEILGGKAAASVGDAFFGGDGDDMWGVLSDAGWSVAWSEAGYFWAMRSPDGQSGITYVEGDIYDGVQKRHTV